MWLLPQAQNTFTRFRLLEGSMGLCGSLAWSKSFKWLQEKPKTPLKANDTVGVEFQLLGSFPIRLTGFVYKRTTRTNNRNRAPLTTHHYTSHIFLSSEDLPPYQPHFKPL